MNTALVELVGLCRVFGSLERDQVCCGGVTVQQCITLQALLDGPIEVASLASRVGNSASAMTRLVDGLEKRAWANRVRDTKDRRKVHVSLTPAGRREAWLLKERTEATLQAVFDRIPAERHADVIDCLGLIRQAMEEAAEEPLSCCNMEFDAATTGTP